MKIVHYILGFPPHRSGGMTKYAIDLMKAQIDLQHDVVAIYPGNPSFFSKKSKLIKKKECNGIKVWKLKNAMPVSLLYGIKDEKYFYAKREIIGFNEFINKVKPDIIHIHTLMGLPKELITLFRNNEIKIVFTTHDYFGLCPKVNFIDNSKKVCSNSNADKCKSCCKNSRNILFLKLRNSEYLTPLKKLLK